MNELTKPIKDIIDRGKVAQRKTVEGILEFSLCVVELKNSPEVETVSGGSNFTKLCADEWGIGQSTSAKFLGIGLKNAELIRRANNLPSSPDSIFALAALESPVLDSIIKEGIVTADTTRADIRAYTKLIKRISKKQAPANEKEITEMTEEVKKLKEEREQEVEDRDKEKEATKIFKEKFEMTEENKKKVLEAENIIEAEKQRLKNKKHQEDVEAIEKAEAEQKENDAKKAEKEREKRSNTRKCNNPKASPIHNVLDCADDELLSKIRKSILNMTHPDKVGEKYIDIYKTITETK